jgi:GT2 family glycosyltransferase
MAAVDVLIPTCGRKTGLAIVLASLLGQTFRDFDVVILDQTEEGPYLDSPEIRALVQALRWRGHSVEVGVNLPRRGLAHQRQRLLDRSRARYVQFLDDDVLLDPPVLERMVRVIREERCGFVGCPAAGLEYLPDVRPHQQHIELWDGPVRPEPVGPENVPMHRLAVVQGANLLHLERRLVPRAEVLRFKVAWVGGANVLYDRAKLLEVGGFGWWDRLPPDHAGEETLTQLLLLREHGGCGILPTGTYHLLLPTTVPDRSRDARELFADLLRERAAGVGGLGAAEGPR